MRILNEFLTDFLFQVRFDGQCTRMHVSGCLQIITKRFESTRSKPTMLILLPCKLTREDIKFLQSSNFLSLLHVHTRYLLP